MKSKHLLLLLLLAIGLPWAANAQKAIPYSYGFEDNNLATDGWILSGSTSSSTKIYSESDAPEGSYLFKFHYSERNAYLISPLLSGTGNGVEVTFQYMRNSSTSSYQEQFQVGYTTDENVTDPTEFTYGGTVYSGTSWLTYENSFPANTKRIAIKYIYIDGYYLRLDDFHFNLPASCPKPIDLVCTAYTANTATLSWTENGTATNWVIEYADNANFTGAQTANASGTPSKQLTGLTAEQTYYARVKADCGDGDQSDWSNTCEFKPSAYTIIGTGTSTAGYAPLYGNYNNSYDQMIYTASQLGLEASEITKIAFNSSAANSNARTISIYMGHTTKSSFSNAGDFISINDLTEVYSGTWNITAGWNEFELTTPFDYDGSSNLVIALYSKGTYKSTTFYYTATSSSQVVYAYSDSNDPNPNTYEGNWSNFNSRSTTTYLPNLKLLAVVSSTPKPRNLVVSNITSEGATVTWQAPADNVTGYQYQYKFATTPTWPDTWNSLAANVTHKDLTLAANTTYDFRVRANYAEGDSDPAEIQFTTEATCLPVTNITVSDITSNSAKLAWTPGGSETNWQYICVAHGDTPDWTSELVITSNTNTNVPANILAGTGQDPQPNTEYDFYVRANCGGGDYSEAAMLTFRTACGAITSFPITYGFETSEGFPSNASAPTTNELGTCWRNEATVQNGSNANRVWGTSTYYKHTGSQALVLPDKGNSTNFAKTMLVFPEMEFTSANGYTVSFWIYRSGSSSNPEGFKLYVSDCDTIGPNAVELGHYSRNYSIAYPDIVTSGWYQYETAPITRTGSVYIIFEGQSYYGSATYVDDITIKEYVAVTADQIVNTVSDPATEMTWDEFVTHWNNGDHFTSTTFTLMDDITVSTMVGTSDKPFTGTFEGSSKTINVNITTTETGAAPFSHIKDATIQNLRVTGTISSSANHLGGLVGFTDGGTNHIENCLVSTTLTGEAGYGLCGGIIGHGKSAVNYIEGCVFNGTIDVTNTDTSRAIGGLLGWSDTSELHIINSVFAGTKTENGTQRFHPMGCVDSSKSTTGEITNSYYFTNGTIADNDSYAVTKSNNLVGKGKHAYTITGVSPVNVFFAGDIEASYTLCGINAYATGIVYGGLIAGEGDNVNLTLSGAPGYEANHGTLTANGDNFILTMEAYDTEISGVDCPVPYNVAVTNLEARSAKITWTGSSDSYTLQYREVISAPVDVNDTYDFEDGTQGWTTIDADGHGNAWSRVTSGGHNSSSCMKATYNSSYAHQDYLVSPQITLGGSFSFYIKMGSSWNDTFRVYLSTGSNTSASDFTIELTDGDVLPTDTYEQYTYDLSDYSGLGYVAIVYTAPKDQLSLYVDDVAYTNHVDGEYGAWQTVNDAVSPQPLGSLTPETTYQVKVMGTCSGVDTDYSDVAEFTTPATCPAPTTLAVTEGSVTAHEATITWTENGEATTWIVEYADNADFTGALTETVKDNATFSFDELDGETTYYVRVKAHCSDEDESDYSNVVNFTTLVACPTPTVLTVTAKTSTTATLSWTENGTATAWQICLNGDETHLINVTTNPYTIDTLTAATAYTAKVRANCGGIDGESAWSNTVNFVTECDVITITAATPYRQDFEAPVVTTTYSQIGEMPVCWENYPVNNAASAKILAEDVTYNYADEGQVLYFYGEGNNYAVLPEFTNALNTLQISFKYATESSSYGTLTLGFISNGDVGFNTFQPVSQFTIYNASSDSDDTFVELDPISLQSLPATATRLVFRWYYSGQWGCNVDDVEVSLRPIPSFTKTIAAVGEENWEGGRGGYYLITTPVGTVSPAEVGMITDEEGSDEITYDLYSFNQAQDLEWQNYRAFNFNIVGGQGYLYASKNGVTLTFTGDPTISDACSVELFKTDNTNVDFQGWNLVGNPLSEDAYIEKPFYTLENSDTYTANEAGTAIHVIQGLFVVADEDGEMLTFTTEAPSKSAKLNMNLRSANKQLDNAILVFGGEQQLGKMMFRENSSKIYMPVEGKEYAVATAEGNVGEMPVNFKAENNGTYTLSFNAEEVSFAYLHLVDNMTGIETDLLANPSYSFDAKTTDYESRFKLVFATGNNANDDAFAFFSNGSFVINNEGNATLQVIDVNGRVLKNESINGCANVNVKAAAGVYMLRLVNGNDVKVQKVVVR